MKLAHTNRFVALKNELGRDNRNCIRPTRLSATQTLKVRRRLPASLLAGTFVRRRAGSNARGRWSLSPVTANYGVHERACEASNGRDCFDLKQEIRIGQPAQHAKRACRWVVAKVLLKDRARLGHVVRIADKDRHLHNVF